MGSSELSGLDNAETIAAELTATDEEIASEEQAFDASNQTPAASDEAASGGSPDEEKQ